MKYDVVIVGGGLGGLQCAYILSKKGMNVCIVEKEHKLGGCLQMFSRHRSKFDTGFHYVGGLGDGEPLNRIFTYFGLMDLPWLRLDDDAFDEVVLQGESYNFASGYNRFADTLADSFPYQREALQRYISLLQDVNRNIVRSFDRRDANETYTGSLFSASAYDYLNETFSDKRLLQVVSGTSLKMELMPETLPLYIFAQINSSFIQSAWRLQGGGDMLVDRLVDNVRAMGATVVTGCGVDEFVETGGRIMAVRLQDGSQIEAGRFVSDIHPAATMVLLRNSSLVRRIYRNRLSNMPNTCGMFTVNCRLRPGKFRYINRNIYIYDTYDVWQLCRRTKGTPLQGVMISFQPPLDGSDFTCNVDILTPLGYSEVEQWAGTRPLHRPDEYNCFKHELADRCIAFAGHYLPGLAENIEAVYTSTPLSYQYYTATQAGSAYGIRKDYSNLMYTLLTPRTPAGNLFLTGQNLNLHGVLGVSMTAFMTCSEIVGAVSPFEHKPV